MQTHKAKQERTMRENKKNRESQAITGAEKLHPTSSRRVLCRRWRPAEKRARDWGERDKREREERRGEEVACGVGDEDTGGDKEERVGDKEERACAVPGQTVRPRLHFSNFVETVLLLPAPKNDVLFLGAGDAVIRP